MIRWVLIASSLIVLVVVGTGAIATRDGLGSVRAGCSPPSVAVAWQGDRSAPQVIGTRKVKLRTLFFLPQGASWADAGRAVFAGLVGQEVKIAWGMVGSGRFSVVAVGPAGERVLPSWGPERHSGGNWLHPGGEWGTGFVFPERGCWRLHAVRRHRHRSGDIWLSLT
jgi:hypothetical protein